MSENTYFLGGASPEGFRTSAGKTVFAPDCFTYIIKGTAGSGKSTLMKKIAAAFPDEDKDIYICSADPSSYDAVHLKERGVMVVDGTAPHVFEPEYPFASQVIVDAGKILDRKALRSRRDEIREVTDEYKACHLCCRRYLTALAAILSDMENIGAQAMYTDKLDSFISRFCRRVLPARYSPGRGTLFTKQLSAITPRGYMTLPAEGCRIYTVNDEYFAASSRFLRGTAEYALSRGYDVIMSESYLHKAPLCESIVIPAAGTAFYAKTAVTEELPAEYAGISMKRFYDKKLTAEKKPRMRFDRRACADLLEEAADSLVKAKEIHDGLESIYISAADFAGTDALCCELTEEIRSVVPRSAEYNEVRQ